jgi:hypothetical protein
MVFAGSGITVNPGGEHELYDALLGFSSSSEEEIRAGAGSEATFGAIDRFWQQSKLDAEAFICIDSAPFYPGGQNSLPQKIMVSTPLARDGSRLGAPNRETFDIYYSNALQSVRSEIYLFFHPVLTGYRMEGNVIPGHRSAINQRSPGVPEDISAGFLEVFDWFMARYRAKAAVEGVEDATLLQVTTTRTAQSSLIAYRGTVRPLELPDASDYRAFLGRYFDRVADVRPSLLTGEAFQAMNAAYHARLTERLAALRPATAQNSSFMMMFPVNLVPPAPTSEAPAGLPLSYRGGCWIYLSVPPGQRPALANIHSAMLHLARELWFVLSAEYNDVATAQITSFERWAARGSMLHQLPNDFASMSATLAKIREIAAQAPSELRARLQAEVERLDVFLVQGMFLGAAARSRRFEEMPHDIAEPLQKAFTEATVRPVFDRLVKSVAAVGRVAAEKGWKERGWTDGERPRKKHIEEAMERVDFSVRVNHSLVPDRGFFPLLLVILRNAFQHSLIWTLLHPEKRASLEVVAEQRDGEDVVTIVNTGLPAQAAGTGQQGLTDDLTVFRGHTGEWYVEEPHTATFACFSEAKSEWTTVIKRPGSS